MSGNDDYGSGFGGTLSGNISYGSQTISSENQPQESQAAPNSMPLDLGASQPSGPLPVKDISTAEFMTEVIDASNSVPVLVDFWAPWCEPCKQLAPIIESTVAATNGAVKLVKMNIDEHPEVAGKMGIQSIPAVVAFVGGQPKDAITGIKPAAEIKAFIEKIAGPTGPSELDKVLEEAAGLMEQKNYQEAGQLYSAILQQIPDNVPAIAGLGTALLELGDLDGAKDILSNLQNYENEPELKALASAIELAKQAGDLGEIDALAKAVSESPKDHQAKFDLAVALNAHGKRDEAADHLLEIVKADRKWEDDGAKAQLLKFFEAWGPMDEATLTARRKLSSILFS